MQRLSYLRHRHLSVFFEFLFRSDERYPVVDLLLHSLRYLSLRHLYTVENGLVHEEFLQCYLLRQAAVWVAFNYLSFRLHLCSELFNVREENCFVSHHPYHFVHHGARFLVLDISGYSLRCVGCCVLRCFLRVRSYVAWLYAHVLYRGGDGKQACEQCRQEEQP